jgi:Transposase
MPGRDDIETSENNRRKLQGLPVIRRNVAGIDLGSERHWVCAPTRDGGGREIATFGATTPELIRMAEWLKARQVESVAMESTGVYWIAPHEVLEAQGLQLLLVDTRQLARVPGRGQENRSHRLRVDSAAAQLRLATSFVPAGGNSMHAANAGAG